MKKYIIKHVLTLSIGLIAGGLVQPAAKAGGHLNCQAYAQSVINQVNESNKWGCGYSGAQWSPDFNFHFNWCNQDTTQIHHLGEQENFRKAKLHECKLTKPGSGVRPANAYNEEQCHNYAKQMVSNAKINVTRSCGIKDPRMHQNYQAHWEWCFNGRTKQQVRTTLDEVIASIKQCGSNIKTYVPRNFRNVPLDGCFDNKGGPCGQAVADSYCKINKGHKRARSYQTGGTDFSIYLWCLDQNAAQLEKSKNVGLGCFCSSDSKTGCGYFKQITCEGKR